MNIVKYIAEHTGNLRSGLTGTLPEQRKSMIIALLGFYFLLDDFEYVIGKYINIDISKDVLIADIKNENVSHYQKANEKSNIELDEYADDYEEPEYIEICILDAFSIAVSDINDVENIVGLFSGIIDVLDYYENFSDHPEVWNDMLEKEVHFQNEILSEISSKKTLDPFIYEKRYREVIANNKE